MDNVKIQYCLFLFELCILIYFIVYIFVYSCLNNYIYYEKVIIDVVVYGRNYCIRASGREY